MVCVKMLTINWASRAHVSLDIREIIVKQLSICVICHHASTVVFAVILTQVIMYAYVCLVGPVPHVVYN